MIDIVERLRVCAKFDPDQAEAADEIERLREEIERWRSDYDRLEERATRMRLALDLMAESHLTDPKEMRDKARDAVWGPGKR